jgi:hypothetical protein
MSCALNVPVSASACPSSAVKKRKRGGREGERERGREGERERGREGQRGGSIAF